MAHTYTFSDGRRGICVYSTSKGTRPAVVTDSARRAAQKGAWLFHRTKQAARESKQEKFARADNALFGGNFEERLRQIRGSVVNDNGALVY